jgi:hypothetical protein
MIYLRTSTHTQLRIATLTGASIVLAVMMTQYWDIQRDDAYIFFSYAKNLVNGQGYVFNPGERVNATTSPLYTFFLSAMFVLLRGIPGVTIPFLGHCIGAISLFLMCFFLMRTFEDGSSQGFALVLPLVLLANPLLAGGIGMETFMAMMLGTGCIFAYVKGRLRIASLVCSFAVLARPDLILLAALMVGYHLVRTRRFPTITMVGLFMVPILAWLIFSYWYFGNLLPSTLAAKLAQTKANLWGEGLVFFKGFTAGFIWFGGDMPRDPLAKVLLVSFAGILFTAGFLGIITILMRYREWSIFKHPAFHLIVLWNVTYLVAYGLVLNAPAYSWYYTPLSLTLALVMSLPLEALHRLVLKTDRGAVLVFLPAVLAVLVGMGCLGPTLPLRNWELAKYETYKRAAEWLNADAKEGSAVGAGDIGVLRYFYEKGPVICEVGLVTPDVVDHLLQGEYDWYVRHYHPDYLMLNHPPRAEIEDMVGQEWFENDYRQQTVIHSERISVALYQRNAPSP